MTSARRDQPRGAIHFIYWSIPIMTRDTAAVILAAGKGTRMKSQMAKALFHICGKTLARHTIDTVRDAGIADVVLVIGHQRDEVRAATGDDVRYAVQDPQHGTGHALQCAEEALRGFTGTVLVHCVDVPLLPAEILTQLLRRHHDDGNAATVLTAVQDDAGNYGRIVRDATSGAVLRIVEARDASDAERALGEFNAGTYCFEAPVIFEVLRDLTPNNAQGELYLTDAIAKLRERGLRVGAEIAPTPEMVAGINNRLQLAEAETHMRQRIREHLLLNVGVTLVDPATTYIDADVEVGQDTIIHPGAILSAGTRVGQRCVIGPYTRLVNAVLEDDVTVDSSLIEHSTLRQGAKVGPLAHLRANCDIGPGAEVGNFGELKNTRLGAKSKAHHVGYLGDTTVGEKVNIGAGTITCNYDGARKHATAIGDGVFIGSGSLLVAPVTVGDRALTGAGSVVTHDIPAGQVAFGIPARVVRERDQE